jgi:hypothetical protein
MYWSEIRVALLSATFVQCIIHSDKYFVHFLQDRRTYSNMCRSFCTMSGTVMCWKVFGKILQYQISWKSIKQFCLCYWWFVGKRRDFPSEHGGSNESWVGKEQCVTYCTRRESVIQNGVFEIEGFKSGVMIRGNNVFHVLLKWTKTRRWGQKFLSRKWLVMKEMDGEDVLRVHLVAGCCEHANEPSDSIKCIGCMDQMSNCWPPKKDAVL